MGAIRRCEGALPGGSNSCYGNDMDQAAALRLLRQAAPELKSRYGVAAAALFGSIARNEGDEASDVDVAVRFDASHPFDVMALCGVSGLLSAVFGRDVDVVSLPARDPRLNDVIAREAVVAF